MANAFVPQGSSFSENENADVFDLDKISNTENVSPSPENTTTVDLEQEPLQPESGYTKNQSETQQQDTIANLSQKIHPHPSQTYAPSDPLTFQIEKIMEQGIGEAYQELSPIQKQQFKLKGEETAKQIKELLQTTRVKVKKVFRLLLEWLKLLPGINRFFLMQEAKIKTDQILTLKMNEKQK